MYDREADAAYIQLADELFAGGVARSYPCDPNGAGMINLDFDDQDRLVGIGVLRAGAALPPELLNQER